MADVNSADSAANTSLRPSNTPSGLRLTRRQSGNERIDEILQTARERAQSMSPENPSSPAQRPQTKSHTAQLGPDEYSADETTGFFSQSPSNSSSANVNYSALNSGTEGRSSRRSAYTRRRQASPLPESPNGTTHDQNGSGRQESGGESWWDKALERFHSIELENKGSVARDHLALERTFLAWLRTSLAFASIGIAVTQLFRLNTSLSGNKPGPHHSTLRSLGKPLGATFLAISVLILLLGYRRYVQGQEWVMKGKFPASRGTILIVVFVAFAIMMLSLVVVIVIHPRDIDQ